MNMFLLLQGIALLGLYGVFVAIAHCLLNLGAHRSDQILAGNIAVAVRRSAFYAGLGICLYATFSTSPAATTFLGRILENALWGGGVLAILFATLWVNDKCIIPAVNNTKAVGEGNLAVALVEAATILGSSFIMSGTMKGEGRIIDTVVFFFIGQGLMIATAWYYEAVTLRVNMQKALVEGNVAAGVLVAGKLLAVSLICMVAITGDFTGWVQDIKATLIYYVIGLAVLQVTEWLVDLFLLPKVRVEDLLEQKAVAPMILVSGISIASALIITAVSIF